MLNFVHVPFDDDKKRKKWVLFLSIGPSAALGEALPNISLVNLTAPPLLATTTTCERQIWARIGMRHKPDTIFQTARRHMVLDGQAIGSTATASLLSVTGSDMSLSRKFTIREAPLNVATKPSSLISRPIDLSTARLPSGDIAMIICKRLTGVDLPCLNT
ncbi:hypothetical protein DPV78_007092 [Talaromyces pinophilus]|nr:hypothetical protein DPV78_007092 [Talaromyces pinophilus]